MTGKMEIELAVSNLKAGKFSFRMVDAILDHLDKLGNEVAGLENELAVARSLHASAVSDLRRQELANWRLESEMRKLNANIYALIKANILTETALRETKIVATKMGDYLLLARKNAAPAANTLIKKAVREITPAVIKLGEYLQLLMKHALPQAKLLIEKAARETTPVAIKMGENLQLVAKRASPQTKLLTEKAIRETTPVAIKIGENLEIAKNHVGASLHKATTYLSTLHKHRA